MRTETGTPWVGLDPTDTDTDAAGIAVVNDAEFRASGVL
jgi:hypothetical protein